MDKSDWDAVETQVKRLDEVAVNLFCWLESGNKTSQAILEAFLTRHGYTTIESARKLFESVRPTTESSNEPS
jgi:hypothetical protein